MDIIKSIIDVYMSAWVAFNVMAVFVLAVTIKEKIGNARIYRAFSCLRFFILSSAFLAASICSS